MGTHPIFESDFDCLTDFDEDLNLDGMSLGFSGAQLLCKNKCGFYGNESWDGYCSLCFKRAKREEHKKEESPKSESPKSTSWFDFSEISLFGEKRKARLSLTSAFSSGSGSSSSRSGGRSPEAEPTPKADLISRQLLTLVDKQSVEFVAKTKKKNFAPEEFGEVITTFYDALADAIRTKEDDDETVSICMDRAEANITSEIYQKLFAQEEDEAADIDLQRKIRALHWIGPAMVGAKLDRGLPEVKLLIDDAVTNFLQTNSSELPREKLEHLSAACDCIMKSLSISTSSSPSADDLLPALIFLLLHTNPPLFKSNLALIRRLSQPENLRSGKLAYHYCSICSAVGFIERGITETELNLTKRQFEQFQKSEARPPAALMDFDFTTMRKTSRIVDIFDVDDDEVASPALERLRHLKLKNEEFFSKAKKIKEELTSFSMHVQQEVTEISEKYAIAPDEQSENS